MFVPCLSSRLYLSRLIPCFYLSIPHSLSFPKSTERERIRHQSWAIFTVISLSCLWIVMITQCHRFLECPLSLNLIYLKSNRYSATKLKFGKKKTKNEELCSLDWESENSIKLKFGVFKVGIFMIKSCSQFLNY